MTEGAAPAAERERRGLDWRLSLVGLATGAIVVVTTVALSALLGLEEAARDARLQAMSESARAALRHRLEAVHAPAAERMARIAADSLAAPPLAAAGFDRSNEDERIDARARAAIERQLELGAERAAQAGGPADLLALVALDRRLRPIAAYRAPDHEPTDWSPFRAELAATLAAADPADRPAIAAQLAGANRLLTDLEGGVVRVTIQPVGGLSEAAPSNGYLAVLSAAERSLGGLARSLEADVRVWEASGAIVLDETRAIDQREPAGRGPVDVAIATLEGESGVLYRIEARAPKPSATVTARFARHALLATAFASVLGVVALGARAIRRGVDEPARKMSRALAAIGELATDRAVPSTGSAGDAPRTLEADVERAVAAWRRLRERASRSALQASASTARSRRRNRAEDPLGRDPLTGALDRSAIQRSLNASLERAARDGGDVAALAVDLDRLAAINDAHGEALGDAVLRAVTARLQALAGDEVGRIAGDRFLIVQSGLEPPHGCAEFARKVLASISQPIEAESRTVEITASIGIALARGGEMAAGALISQSELALQASKQSGRGGFCFFEETMQRRYRARQRAEQALAKTIECDGFLLHYQPQFQIQPSGARFVGVEALLRGRHPEFGLLAPDEIVPIAEETGQIVPIGGWALTRACADAAPLPGKPRVAVNLSPVQLREPFLLEQVADALVASGLEPERLELEITEGVSLDATGVVADNLARLEEMGARIVLDDFGAGYAALGYLRKFPFAKIKLDRSFVAERGDEASRDAIIEAVVGLSRSLGMRLNAEGVETEAQLDAVRRLGVGEAQGYFLARPMRIERLRAWIDAERVGECAAARD